MSKQYLKGLVSGIIITILLTSVVFASTKTIDVLFNGVNIEVNGQKVNADNILYNGTTYVPLRVTAEMLGMEVGWIQETGTATLKSKIIPHAEDSENIEDSRNFESKELKLLSITSPITAASEASITIAGTPKSTYSIIFADPYIGEPLEAKVAGEDGKVNWTWKLDQRNKPGNYALTIIDFDSGQVVTSILVVE
ncbi:stalk domain-containing protein [Alkaliphilus peptidifermentans]|uniref:Copper amine oxidase N-terminal domain-containing protein n=1 Tax=Alkaliphilus peptidifermentans DSM 18978 TaxID=1120976 RepID=A0A1G5L527_9FIRM|nr:stalk domain-containing protein [Alkaliphilus peptidifermentans]SCZ07975.1 Copper amine oxidase N-terminal domain-containing protein [Alkaliphilus peptidifermentans DSM 18978]